MRKRICFLLLGTQLFSSFLLLPPLSAMDVPLEKIDTFLEKKTPKKTLSPINQIRQQYDLPLSTTSQLPSIIRTGYALETYEQLLPSRIDLETIDFEELLASNPFTPYQINEFLPLDQWTTFLETMKKEGKKLNVTVNSHNNGLVITTDDDEEQSTEQALKQQAQWHLAKAFMQKLQRAVVVIPPSLYETCPASLIVKQAFSKDDSVDLLALKYYRLGLDINSLEHQMKSKDRHFLMGEVFKLAGSYYLTTAKQSRDPFAKPDLYFTSGTCFGWSAMHGDSRKVDETLKSAQEAMHMGHDALSQAYKHHREITNQIRQGTLTDYQQGDLDEIKKQLMTLPMTLIRWTQKFDPLYYQKLVTSSNTGRLQ